jgi:hypothetical protein
MFLRFPHLAALLRRPPAASYAARLQHQRAEANTTRLAAKGLQHALALSNDEAMRIAGAALAAYRQLCAQSSAGSAPPALLRTLSDRLAQHSCLLALPYSLPGLRLLRQLAASGLRTVVVTTPVVEQVLEEIGLPAGRLASVGTNHVVRMIKAGTPQPTLYISFPELHAGSESTRTWVSFNGMRHGVSLLEPLLCCLGLEALYTLTPAEEPELTILRLTPLKPRDASLTISSVTSWLTLHLQAAASALPAQTLSWSQLYRASAPYLQVERDDQLKQLNAYIDAWHRHGDGLDGGACAAARARLAAWAAQPVAPAHHGAGLPSQG